MLQSGDIISGMYQVIREIGTGGMGVIYIGYHLHLQKQIVIKKIKETCVDRVNVRGEADILKQLRHTYLPQVYDFLEVGNDVYTVTAYQAGNEERIGTVKNQWYRQALAYYEMLCQKNDPSYEDRLGRALLLRVLGKYRDSTDVLEEMKIDYPKDYKVQMWICYNYLDEASEEGTYSNVSGDLKFTYHSCRNLYENRADRSEEDPDMEMLEETMKELE